ncbi:MAG TPA: S8 family serine peptidase [Burkholderiales bacterium]|nr:S8 family serine peptidase [Burkholderiales bacterium]
MPVAGLPLINAAAIDTLSLLPSVAFVHPDLTVGPRQTSAPLPMPPGPLPSPYPAVVKARRVCQTGIVGSGITVAVLDSGVASDPDLAGPANRVLASVNFADPRTADDPGGHGTHIAGIIAGNGTRSAGEFVGIAPQANIVDVRVLGNTGSGRVSSVVRGIEWVLAHRSAYNIRVIYLSFGAPAPPSYRADLFSAAVEIAWRRGLAVVAAVATRSSRRASTRTQSPWARPTIAAASTATTMCLPGSRHGAAPAARSRSPTSSPRSVSRLAARARQPARHALSRPRRRGAERRHVLPAYRHLNGHRRRVRRGCPPLAGSARAITRSPGGE